MFVAWIGGYEEVIAIAETREKAKKAAMREWKRNCGSDVRNWDWEKIDDWCGATVDEVKGSAFTVHCGEVRAC